MHQTSRYIMSRSLRFMSNQQDDTGALMLPCANQRQLNQKASSLRLCVRSLLLRDAGDYRRARISPCLER